MLQGNIKVPRPRIYRPSLLAIGRSRLSISSVVCDYIATMTNLMSERSGASVPDSPTPSRGREEYVLRSNKGAVEVHIKSVPGPNGAILQGEHVIITPLGGHMNPQIIINHDLSVVFHTPWLVMMLYSISISPNYLFVCAFHYLGHHVRRLTAFPRIPIQNSFGYSLHKTALKSDQPKLRYTEFLSSRLFCLFPRFYCTHLISTAMHMKLNP